MDEAVSVCAVQEVENPGNKKPVTNRAVVSDKVYKRLVNFIFKVFL